MNFWLGDVSVQRENLALPRFLAVILFSLAAFLALVTANAAVTLLSVDWYAIKVIAAAGPITCMLTWLGTVLWSGRPIPKWFIAAFGIGIAAGAVMADGTWLAALVMLAVFIPMLLSYQPALLTYQEKPTASKRLDDLV